MVLLTYPCIEGASLWGSRVLGRDFPRRLLSVSSLRSLPSVIHASEVGKPTGKFT